jgi:hypothetical protein
MRLKVFLLLSLFSIVSFAVAGCEAPGDCPDCKLLDDSLQANMFLDVDPVNHYVKASLYYENISESPPRQPINFSTVIVHVFNDTIKDTYRIYTDEQGLATFNFSQYSEGSVNFKFLYCPFTNPVPGETGNSKCGFLQCIDFAAIECSLPNCEAGDLEDAPGATPPSQMNYFNLLPAIQSANYSPPALPLLSTPQICLPALIIFALLAGALFVSGRNPFAGFDFSAPRIGRHIRYQARGRGVSISAPRCNARW